VFFSASTLCSPVCKVGTRLAKVMPLGAGLPAKATLRRTRWRTDGTSDNRAGSTHYSRGCSDRWIAIWHALAHMQPLAPQAGAASRLFMIARISSRISCDGSPHFSL
jgi:hypothetical protein